MVSLTSSLFTKHIDWKKIKIPYINKHTHTHTQTRVKVEKKKTIILSEIHANDTVKRKDDQETLVMEEYPNEMKEREEEETVA